MSKSAVVHNTLGNLMEGMLKERHRTANAQVCLQMLVLAKDIRAFSARRTQV